MSLSNYTEMREGLLKWLNREGFTELADLAPDLIAIAQRRIMRETDLDATETVSTLTINAASVDAPADLARLKSLSIPVGGINCELQGAPVQEIFNGAMPAGIPQKFAAVGTKFYFYPVPNEEFVATIVYHRKLPILSEANPTNWFTEDSPELLLFAAMVEACLVLKDDVRAQVWEARYQALKNTIERSESRKDREPGGLQVRAR